MDDSATLLVTENDGDLAPFVRYGALAKRELEFGALQTDFDFTGELGRVPFEILLLAGSESGPDELAKQERHRERFPQARLDVIAGATHNGLTGDHAEAVVPLLVDYFAERGATQVAVAR